MSLLRGRRGGGWLCAWLVVVAAPGAAARGQDLGDRIARAPDGYVRFTYEARPGVCGNGRSISVRDDDPRRREDELRRSRDWDWECEEGPIRAELRVRGGVVRDLDIEVGGIRDSRSGQVTDLGDVPPAIAAEYLFRLAETGPPEVGKDALFPATIARGVVAWPRLLEIARGGAETRVRRQAVFWLGQEAGERATAGLTSIIADDDELEVREHAVFALSQRPEPGAVDALIAIARDNREPMLRKRAIFWLGQHGDDPRVLDFLEELLRGGP